MFQTARLEAGGCPVARYLFPVHSDRFLFTTSFRQESGEPPRESNFTSARIDEDRGSRYSLAQIPVLVAITNPRPLKIARVRSKAVPRAFGSPSNSTVCWHLDGHSLSYALSLKLLQKCARPVVRRPDAGDLLSTLAVGGSLLPAAARRLVPKKPTPGGYINL